MIQQLTPQIAELLGMHVGDGTLYRTQRGLVWELRGNLDEKEYYTDNVVPLLKFIFKKDFVPKFRSGGKNGCFGIQTSDKDVTSLFLTFGFLPGKKTKTVTMPEYIRNADKQIRFAFIRGLFDTDGCLRFERKNKDTNHKYPRLEFSTSSKQLCEDLFVMLNELGFKPHRWGKKEFKVSLCGKSNLEQFMKDTAPKNTKHLNKHLSWRKQGYLNPVPRSHNLVVR